jgi:hypothetical protein
LRVRVRATGLPMGTILGRGIPHTESWVGPLSFQVKRLLPLINARSGQQAPHSSHGLSVSRAGRFDRMTKSLAWSAPP